MLPNLLWVMRKSIVSVTQLISNLRLGGQIHFIFFFYVSLGKDIGVWLQDEGIILT